MVGSGFAMAAAAWLLVPAHGAGSFVLGSPSVRPGGTLPDTHVYNAEGCHGKNLSPALKWSGAPQGTKSFAVTAYDPDARWWHWAIYDIPARVEALPEGAGKPDGDSSSLLPAGALQARNDFGAAGFGGACPPLGDKPHLYVFTVYALRVDKLSVPHEAGAAEVDTAVKANELGSASLTANYGRAN
jgi:Raf kinase inhibitor-like YbhB/YbcL family protein